MVRERDGRKSGEGEDGRIERGRAEETPLCNKEIRWLRSLALQSGR